MCFSPQQRAIFVHRNFQNGSAPVVLCILTCKCAFRHSRVQFLCIATSKMAPALRCFLHFDLQMCFSPQRRAIFEHRNFQNGSANVVFCAFWLANVLRATAAWHFSPVCQNSYLRTRRFSEATFRTAATTNHWENTAIRDVTNICRACWTPCYWLYTHVDLLATDSTRLLIFLLLTLHTCWSSCYWLYTPVDLLATDSTHMLIFLLLTWLLCDSAFQLYILSEVRLLNFLRLYTVHVLFLCIYNISKICHKNPAQCYCQRPGSKCLKSTRQLGPQAHSCRRHLFQWTIPKRQKKKRRSVSYPWYLAFVNLNQKIGGKFTFTIIFPG